MPIALARPRLRPHLQAASRFGRRPVEPAERFALPASKNQHKNGSVGASRALPRARSGLPPQLTYRHWFWWEWAYIWSQAIARYGAFFALLERRQGKHHNGLSDAGEVGGPMV